VYFEINWIDLYLWYTK